MLFEGSTHYHWVSSNVEGAGAWSSRIALYESELSPAGRAPCSTTE